MISPFSSLADRYAVPYLYMIHLLPSSYEAILSYYILNFALRLDVHRILKYDRIRLETLSALLIIALGRV